MDPIVHSEDQISLTVEDDGIVRADCDSDAESAVSHGSSHLRIGIFDGLMVHRLEKGSYNYEILSKGFVHDLNSLRERIDIVGIHKKRYDLSVIDAARMRVFRGFTAAVARRNNGQPNTKFGWFCGSGDEIRDILLHGFRRFENRSSLYGRGVYLSSAGIPMESLKASVADPDGLRHVLLCQVILGKPETVSFGSEKDQPSSMEFHSGVDNLLSPTKYVIWEPYMNTSILPAYIISFKTYSQTGVQSTTIPTLPNMNMDDVMRKLTNYLSSLDIFNLMTAHYEYSQNKISEHAYVAYLIKVAGIDVIRTVYQLGSR